ncbi:hypothetical protein HPB50_013231 [Hyalomma asiaticum]|uniref:Uncharacterized protein n=1 Tax=Hyalomma asiaticum TaxID=266040 RepID=A0ACB7TFT9_HYAAI|nr:hypothetical protein HPB50_013231 [Hyalomma asiaticum]
MVFHGTAFLFYLSGGVSTIINSYHGVTIAAGSYYVSYYQDSAIAFTVHETPRPSGVEALPSDVAATEGFGYGRRPFISAAT